MAKNKPASLTRRTFLQGLAGGAASVGALSLAGCAPTAKTAQGTPGSEGDAGNGETALSSTGQLNPQDFDYRTNSISDFSTTTLFSPWQLGPITLPHRMVKSAAFQLAFLANNRDEYINYYLRMAKGGVKMIWVEDCANIWDVTASPLKHNYEDYDMEGLLDALHAEGAYVGYQFDTMGSKIGPLDFEENFLGDYSTEEVRSWEKVIVDIAKRLKEDGFDAFELNFAANNLGQSFLSRARNNREDEYGPQTIESRTRFAVDKRIAC